MAVIETTALARQFGTHQAVRGIDLHVPKAQVYAFLGGNGAGKSTTIRMLLNLLPPSSGSISLFGEELNARSARELIRRTGSLVESPALYEHLTAYENLKLNQRVLGCAASRIDDVLAQVGLADDARRRVGQYSLGMKQRLGLALALLHQPELLILDEPTNGLDPAGIREMRELLRNLPRQTGVTVFVSSHMLDEVEKIADCVGVLHQGQLRYQGSLSALHATQVLEIGAMNPRALAITLAQADLRYDVGQDNGYWRVYGATPERVAQLSAALAEAGAGLYHLHLRRPGLEDLFFDLTNEGLTDQRRAPTNRSAAA